MTPRFTSLTDPETMLTNQDPAAATASLALSDKFKPEMDLIAQGLQRPLARMEGDYRNALDLPIPNWLAFQTLAQMLSLRSHCHLLLGQPEAALADLTLLHQLRPLLEGPPGGLPETAVASAIDAALAGLFASRIGEGTQTHAWTEAQLQVLQNQLKEIDLPLVAIRSLESKQAFDSEVINTLFSTLPVGRDYPPSFSYPLLAWLLPRGWLDQNRSAAVRCDQQAIENFRDPAGAIHPEKLPANPSPTHTAYHFLAEFLRSDYRVLAVSVGQSQTEVLQALIACGLERYRLARRHYPASLAALVPAYLDHVPNDAIGGAPPIYQLETNDTFRLSSAGGQTNRLLWPPSSQ